jgi:hypothetical protein
MTNPIERFPWQIGSQYSGDQIAIVEACGSCIGSIRKFKSRGMRRWSWRVEILWPGEGGNVVYIGPFLECVAFVNGVEAMMARQ